MSETIFRFLLRELHTVRIRCRACARVAEMAVSELARTFAGRNACPFCQADFTHPLKKKSMPSLAKLGETLEEVGQIEGMEVEFVLPEPGGASGGGDEESAS